MAAGFVTGPQRIPLSATMTHVLVINQSLYFTKEKKKSVFLTTCSKDPREISTAYDAIVFFFRNPAWIRNDELFQRLHVCV